MNSAFSASSALKMSPAPTGRFRRGRISVVDPHVQEVITEVAAAQPHGATQRGRRAARGDQHVPVLVHNHVVAETARRRVVGV